MTYQELIEILLTFCGFGVGIVVGLLIGVKYESRQQRETMRQFLYFLEDMHLHDDDKTHPEDVDSVIKKFYKQYYNE